MSPDPVSWDLLEGGARRSPLRARLLHAASWTVSATLLAASVAAVQAASSSVPVTARPERAAHLGAPATAAAVDEPPVAVGSTFAGALASLDRSVASAGGRIVEVRMDNPRGTEAGIVLRTELSRGSAAAIARLVALLRSAGVEHVRVDSVTATPSGSLLVVVGSIRPTTAPRPSAGVVLADADVTVRLSELTARTGVEVRRIDTSGAVRNGPIQLRAAGPIGPLSDLLGSIEDGPSAPARIRSLRLDPAGPSGMHQLELVFLLREAPRLGPPSAASRAPVEGSRS